MCWLLGTLAWRASGVGCMRSHCVHKAVSLTSARVFPGCLTTCMKLPPPWPSGTRASRAVRSLHCIASQSCSHPALSPSPTECPPPAFLAASSFAWGAMCSGAPGPAAAVSERHQTPNYAGRTCPHARLNKVCSALLTASGSLLGPASLICRMGAWWVFVKDGLM